MVPWLGFAIAMSVATAAAVPASTARAVNDAHRLPAKFTIDQSHSYLGFTISFMGLSRVHGSFGRFFGTLLLDEAQPERSLVTAVIRTASIATNSESRDRHLQSPDFFDAERFPLIVFRSRNVSLSGANYRVRGDLTMHGVTREIVLPFSQVHPPSRDAWGNLRVGFVARITLNREDYGILGTAFWNREFDPGRMAIGKTVDVNLEIEAIQENVLRWNFPAPDSLVLAVERSGIETALRAYHPSARDTADSALTRAQVPLIAGLKLAYRGMDEAARRLFELAIEQNPSDAWALTTLAESRLRSSAWSAAATLLDRALAVDSTYSDALEWRRWLRQRSRGTQ